MITFTENSASMSETFTGVYFLFLGIQSWLLITIMPQILDNSRFEKNIKPSLTETELKFLLVGLPIKFP